jgi:hypothetical protein
MNVYCVNKYGGAGAGAVVFSGKYSGIIEAKNAQ